MGGLPTFLLTGKRTLGIGHFVWYSSDGFFHGISASILVTFGTGATLSAFSFLARYLQTGQKRYFKLAAVTVFLAALIHASEALLIFAAGSLTLLVGKGWRGAAPMVLLLGACSALGLLPYVVLTLQTPWLQHLSELSRWQLLGSPPLVLLILGLPAMLAVALFFSCPKMASSSDLLLQTWFMCALIGVCLPLLPSPQHLLDGLHYAIAILLVRQFSRCPRLERLRAALSPSMIAAGLFAWCLVSLPAYVFYYVQSFHDGYSARPERLFATILPHDHLEALAWTRLHTSPNDLVLAPPEIASLFMTTPMHSFAGHWHWSLTYREQVRLASQFYGGILDCRAAHEFLGDYGVRYIVVPVDSPIGTCLPDPKVRFTSLAIHDFGGAMKALPPALKLEFHD